ncbi:hypothetical protein DL89DRAFT_21710 [Linderina pennispora]|uniref:Uncharacterized protein n=1 Tax=Linderina pennispora TaxID=61395 RepID=A0A1Y1WMK4_9FUNG|nr:uncharacterized protein DL89DRAFT_21710 [Linderina pennispora]ORX74712.1 hypothetical protein DL89DRAFT_21710 [Linderina pennispora]
MGLMPNCSQVCAELMRMVTTESPSLDLVHGFCADHGLDLRLLDELLNEAADDWIAQQLLEHVIHIAVRHQPAASRQMTIAVLLNQRVDDTGSVSTVSQMQAALAQRQARAQELFVGEEPTPVLGRTDTSPEPSQIQHLCVVLANKEFLGLDAGTSGRNIRDR